MFVYIVIRGVNYEGTRIEKVFNTTEKAESYLEHLDDESKKDWFTIYEFEVQ